MIEIQSCPVCNGQAFDPIATCIDHSISREKFSIIRCTECELLITSPRPAKDQMDKYYASQAYTSHISTAKNMMDKMYLFVRGFTLKWKLSLVETKTIPSTSRRLLDFGCGTGEFLKTAKLHGWQTTGMEPSPLARQQSDPAISLDVKASLQEIIKDDKKFDVITLWHVLEHVEDLNTTLQDLSRLLAQNGTIFIAVPNHNSWDGKHYHQNWAGYDVPRHLWHFSMKNMKHLMEKHSLSVAKIIPMRLDAFYISLLSEKYGNNGSFSVPGMIKALLNALKSNRYAKKNMEYSSLIYVVKK